MNHHEIRAQLLPATLPHVTFDGWSADAFASACVDTDIDPSLAALVCPRGATDLAMDLHRQGDADMLMAFAGLDPAPTKIREKIAMAIKTRLAVIEDRELVQKATTLFAMPHLAPDGAKLIWGTCDAIWNLIGDTSEDVNWYSKRATLAAVYSATVLYWLSDDSAGYANTHDFIDRRIEDVMRIEKAKAAVRGNKLASAVLSGPLAMLGKIRKPAGMPDDLPGQSQPE